MRLSRFIRENLSSITTDWRNFATTLRGAEGMSALRLDDHIAEMLTFIADDIEASQSPSEQRAKSLGLAPSLENAVDSAAETHAGLRQADGFDIVEMVSEYRALRASVIKQWTTDGRVLADAEIADLTRFNEAIDQAVAESVVRFSQKVDRAKDLLLGVLGHDIRSPLATVQMSAQLLGKVGPLTDRQTVLTDQIGQSATRVRHIVTDLLDLAKASLGSGLPLCRATMSLQDLAKGIAAEIQLQNPDRPIRTTFDGDITGSWDQIRLGQVISNLLSNAVQYGKPGSPITLRAAGEPSDVTITVHNDGAAIPRAHLGTIFNSFTRVPVEGEAAVNGSQTANLGLGLFITREVVRAHGGKIEVESSTDSGTIFQITLPRE
jgi:signal transduction histidine kinase